MTTVSTIVIIFVVVYFSSELVVVWKNIFALKMHLLAIFGAICIQNIHHPYILLLPLWKNQFLISGHEHHFIFGFSHGKYCKPNAANFPIKVCLRCHLFFSTVQSNCLAIDEFGPVSPFLNQFQFINPMLLQRYNCFQHT